MTRHASSAQLRQQVRDGVMTRFLAGSVATVRVGETDATPPPGCWVADTLTAALLR